MNKIGLFAIVTAVAMGGLIGTSLVTAPAAEAAACARGVYRAGCVGPNGAVAVRRAPVVRARPVVVAPARRTTVIVR